MPATRATALALTFLLAALAAAPATAPAKPEGIRLDVPAEWPPALCSGRVFLFAPDGRNQTMGPADASPSCNLVQIRPALAPVCVLDAAYVLDEDGTLWRLGEAPALTVASGLKGALALFPTPDGPAVLFVDSLRLPSGASSPLPMHASSAVALAGGGYWVWGSSGATRLDSAGTVRWTWKPPVGTAGPACLHEGWIYAGTSTGNLVAIRDSDGKARFSYRGGGGVECAPVVWKNLVIYASRDHFVRAVDRASGQLAWQARTEGRPDFGPYACDAGLLVAESAGARLLVLAPETGQVAWSWKLPAGAILKAPAVAPRAAAVLAWDEATTPTLYRVELPQAPAPKAKK